MIFYLQIYGTLEHEESRLKSKKNELHTDIQNLKIEIEEKTQVANMLVNDFEYIEKIAREQFRMVKKGEKVFRVRDERTIK